MQCSITFSARFHYRAGGGVPLHRHTEDYQVQLVYGGSAQVWVDCQKWSVHDGDVVMVKKGSTHHFIAGSEGMKTLEAKFDIQDQETLDLVGRIPSHFSTGGRSLFDIFTRIVREGMSRQLGYKGMCDALLLEALTLMARSQDPANKEKEGIVVGSDNERDLPPVIKAVNEYVWQHLHTGFTLSELAKGCGYNQDYLYRAIRRRYGMSAIAYVNQLRFEQAKRLIEHTELSLSEIAWNLGFESVQYFSKFFRQKAGMPPSEYLAKARSAVRIDF